MRDGYFGPSNALGHQRLIWCQLEAAVAKMSISHRFYMLFSMTMLGLYQQEIQHRAAKACLLMFAMFNFDDTSNGILTILKLHE